MNFVTATAEGSALRVGDRHLALNGKAAEVVAGLDNGTELSVGFRPEHLELGEGAPADAIRIPARAEVVEFLGDEELIHARAGRRAPGRHQLGSSLAARRPSRVLAGSAQTSVRPDERAGVAPLSGP